MPADQSWQQAVDPDLVDRLLRRAEQPGLVRPRLAQAVLRRYLAMVAGLPLAELLHRRWEAGLEVPSAPLALVYARPAGWPAAAEEEAAGTRRPASAGPEAQPRPVVEARVAQPGQAPADLPGSSLQAGPDAAPTSGSAARPVAPRPAAGSPDATPAAALRRVLVPDRRSSASPGTPPTAAATPSRRSGGVGPAPAVPGSGGVGPAPAPSRSGGVGPAAAPSWPEHPSARPAVAAARTPAVRAAAPALPLVVPGSPLLGNAGARRGDPPTTAPARPLGPTTYLDPPPAGPPPRPLGPGQPSPSGNGPAVVTAWASPPPAHWDVGAPGAVPVVHEQITHAVRTSGSPAHRQQAFPLADATAAAAATRSAVEPVEPVRSVPATAGPARLRPVPAARGPVQPGRAAPDPAAPADAHRPAVSQVDIERIVDKVHRKLMHRLAIEGERRGMTR